MSLMFSFPLLVLARISLHSFSLFNDVHARVFQSNQYCCSVDPISIMALVRAILLELVSLPMQSCLDLDMILNRVEPFQGMRASPHHIAALHYSHSCTIHYLFLIISSARHNLFPETSIQSLRASSLTYYLQPRNDPALQTLQGFNFYFRR